MQLGLVGALDFDEVDLEPPFFVDDRQGHDLLRGLHLAPEAEAGVRFARKRGPPFDRGVGGRRLGGGANHDLKIARVDGDRGQQRLRVQVGRFPGTQPDHGLGACQPHAQQQSDPVRHRFAFKLPRSTACPPAGTVTP